MGNRVSRKISYEVPYSMWILSYLESYFKKVLMYDFSSEDVGSLGTKYFLNIMIEVENRVMIVLNIMKGIKTGWIPIASILSHSLLKKRVTN